MLFLLLSPKAAHLRLVPMEDLLANLPSVERKRLLMYAKSWWIVLEVDAHLF